MWSDLLREAMKSDAGFSGSIEIKSTGRAETGRNELVRDVRTNNSLNPIDSLKEMIYRVRKISLLFLELLLLTDKLIELNHTGNQNN